MIPLAQLNAASREDFVAQLGAIFEHSPWVADRAYERRPFAARDALLAAMVAAVDEAGPERQLALLRAHPELAGRAAARGEIAPLSVGEQRGSGLIDGAPPDELARLRALNEAYAEKFGFPFIIAVRGLDRAAILDTLARRLGNTPESEFAEALRQVARIAGFRLAAAISEAA